ncbi:MAG: hypothetical protein V3V00_15065 [Saprospiraceae bacterium]
MGLLNDLKKIFFGAESLGKSALNKTKDAAAEVAENLSDEITSKTTGLRDAVLEKASETIESVQKSDILNKTSEKMTEISKTVTEKTAFAIEELKSNETIKKAAHSLDNFSETMQDKASDLAEKAVEKAGDLSESIGTTVFGENNERLDKLQNITEDIGKKVMETKDKVVEQAKELKKDFDERIDETIENAKEFDAKEKFEKQKRKNSPPTDHGDSLLDDEDDFFSKAEKYADGDYSAFSEGKITIDKDTTIKTSSSTPPKNVKKAAGFEDLDGDGNEIVDDAIIDNSDSDA